MSNWHEICVITNLEFPMLFVSAHYLVMCIALCLPEGIGQAACPGTVGSRSKLTWVS